MNVKEAFPIRAQAERIEAFAQRMRAKRLDAQEIALRLDSGETAEALRRALDTITAQQDEFAAAEEELRTQVEELSRVLGQVVVERERYRELFETVLDGVFVTDARGTMREINAAASALIGVDPVFARGKPLGIYVHREDAAILGTAFSGRRQSDKLNVRLLSPDGTVTPVELHVRGGSVERMLWIARRRDVDPPAGTEAQLARALRDKTELLERERHARVALERRDRAKDRFLAVLSHDLRAPLNAVLGWTDLLRRELLDRGRRDRALATIERNARALLSLVEELLDVSRISANRMQLEVSPLDLSALVMRVLEGFQPNAASAGLRLTSEFGGEACPVIGDATRLEQVVRNLVSNAIKFTPAGGSIHVSLAVDGNAVILRVEDTGRGMAKETLASVFECFKQGDDRTTLQQGLGLGLFIVKELVELHGGTVGAHSDGDGHGSVFTVKLPLAGGVDVSPDEASGDELAGEERLAGIRVLVVDDDVEARELACELLRPEGAQLATAATAADALALAKKWRPDVVVSDLGLPVQDGFALMRALRSESGDIAAVALSGYAGTRERNRALDAGFDVHVAKPVRSSTLVEAVLAARKLHA